MKAPITNPTWEQIEQGCVRLALDVMDAIPAIGKPDVIVALVRGGCIPAVRMSHLLGDIPVLAVNYSSKTGKGDNKNHLNTLLPIEGSQNILLVDDICDSGLSLREVYQFYATGGHSVHSAVLYHRVAGHHTPSFVWQTLSPTDCWVHFPWES